MPPEVVAEVNDLRRRIAALEKRLLHTSSGARTTDFVCLDIGNTFRYDPGGTFATSDWVGTLGPFALNGVGLYAPVFGIED